MRKEDTLPLTNMTKRGYAYVLGETLRLRDRDILNSDTMHWKFFKDNLILESNQKDKPAEGTG